MYTADQGDGTYKNSVLLCNYSNPDIIRVIDTYYLTASSFNYVPILPSQDLVNYALANIREESCAVPRHVCSVWVPAIRIREGLFYFFYVCRMRASSWCVPRRSCHYPGYPNPCDSGMYCKQHAEWSSDRLRGNATERGYGGRWRAARGRFLRKHPLCAECLRQGKLSPATVVDHIIPHRGDMKLFWDEQNWQPLCKNCHDRKTGDGL